jgi:hypothetical protein
MKWLKEKLIIIHGYESESIFVDSTKSKENP